MPFRNAAATLPATLRSILRQTCQSFELVAVDDGSSDHSSQLLMQTPNPCIRLLRPGRIGLVAALNLGLRHCRAPIVARMDADDLMHPARLASQYGYLSRNKSIQLVSCRVNLFPEKLLSVGAREYIRWQNGCLSPSEIAREIYWESPVAHPSVMFRKETVLSLGGYRNGPFPEDYDLWLRMVQKGHPMAKLPRVLLYWRESPTRVSRVDPRCSREAFDRLRAHYLARDPRLHQSRPLVVWGAGRVTRKRVALLTRQGFQVAAWIDIDPRKVGNRLAGVPVHAPQWLAHPHQPRPLVLSYVTSHGARERIGPLLERMGYRPGEDYLMVG